MTTATTAPTPRISSLAAHFAAKLGFDPRAAVAAGQRMGLVTMPAGPVQPAVDYDPETEILGARAVADYLGVTECRVRKLIGSGRITPVEVDGAEIFRLSELADLKASYDMHRKLQHQPKLRWACVQDAWAAIQKLRGSEFTRRDVHSVCERLSYSTITTCLTTLKREGKVRMVRPCQGPQSPAVWQEVTIP